MSYIEIYSGVFRGLRSPLLLCCRRSSDETAPVSCYHILPFFTEVWVCLDFFPFMLLVNKLIAFPNCLIVPFEFSHNCKYRFWNDKWNLIGILPWLKGVVLTAFLICAQTVHNQLLFRVSLLSFIRWLAFSTYLQKRGINYTLRILPSDLAGRASCVINSSRNLQANCQLWLQCQKNKKSRRTDKSLSCRHCEAC